MSKDLPEGWAEASLLDVARLKMGQSPPSSTYNTQKRGLPFFQGKAEFGDLFPTPEKFCSSPVKIAEPGDILLSVRAPVGPTNLCRELSCIGRGLAAIHPLGGIPSRYLLFVLRNIESWLGAQGTGSTFTAISKSDLEQLTVPLAPLAEQLRIVAALEQLLEKVGTGQQRLAKVPALLKRFRQSVLAAACSGRLTADWRQENPQQDDFAQRCEQIRTTRVRQLTKEVHDAQLRGQKRPTTDCLDMEVGFGEYDLSEIPKEWGWIHIGYVASVKGGKRLPAGETLSVRDTGQPYIKAANLKEGTVVTNDIQFVPDHLKHRIRNYTVKSGDVYITIVGARIGDAGVIPGKMDGANLTENAAKITGLAGCIPSFVAGWLRSPEAQQLIRNNILSAAQGKLALFRIEQLPLPLPSLAEQQEIVRRVDEFFTLADQIEARVAKARANLDKLAPSLLSCAFRGELVPTEAELARQEGRDYERASVLLERVQRERAENARQSKASLGRKGRPRVFSSHAAVAR